MGLKHHAFLTSLFSSRLGDQILLFLVPLVIFQLTDSVAWSGAAFFFETLPRFIAFPFCGALCDRLSPLKLLRGSQILRALFSFVGIAAYMIFDGVEWLIILSAVCGVLTTQGLMAREVILPQAFVEYRFEKITSYTQIADQLGMVLGPLIAAGLLKFWPWEYIVLSVVGLFLTADALMILWMRVAKPQLTVPEQKPRIFSLVIALQHIIKLPGLIELILLTAAVNLVLGITLATSAAMVTGLYNNADTFYAFLQTGGAIATVIILFITAHISASLRTLGATAYLMIFLGGLVTGLAANAYIYTLGFLLIIGFDKMFNIFIRSMRLRIIPRHDLGKTTGLIVMLNNLSQPLAGLLVTIFSGIFSTGEIITVLSLFMGILGALVAFILLRRIPREAIPG